MIAQLQGAVPDAYVGEDGVLRIIFEIEAGQLENIFLADQLLLEDVFAQTASLTALKQHGIMFDLQLEEGTKAEGTLKFTGGGNTYIPIGTEVAHDPGGSLEPVYFTTTQDGTIPNPGTPSAPTAAIGAAGVLTGLYEYEVTFYTAAGETLPGAESTSVNPSSQKVDLSNIPIGGTGTVGRKIYRQKDGTGDFKLVTTITNNVDTTYTDNIADGSLGATAPSDDTAHAISLTAEAELAGQNGNVIAGGITVLTNAPTSLISVTNLATFTGGSDLEETESYRSRLLNYLRNPQTGSPTDLKQWAEEDAEVDSATVFENDDLGTPKNGHVTLRIAGPAGAVPDSTVINRVQLNLDTRDVANITIHVASFTPVTQAVTVDVTVATGYTLGDVTPNVQQAVTDYINALPVGATMYLSGIIDAVFGLSGILDVVVTSPGSNQTATATQKHVAGTITVT